MSNACRGCGIPLFSVQGNYCAECAIKLAEKFMSAAGASVGNRMVELAKQACEETDPNFALLVNALMKGGSDVVEPDLVVPDRGDLFLHRWDDRRALRQAEDLGYPDDPQGEQSALHREEIQ